MDAAWVNIFKLDLTDWITALATLTLAFLTYVYVRLTKNILEVQSDPCVIVVVRHDDDRSSVLQLVITNIGSGVARDVRFELSRPLPKQAWGLNPEKANPAETMTDGPLINGIPALGPGETRKTDWGQFGGLKAAIGGSPIVVTCKCKKGNKEMEPVECPLEIDSFVGTVAAESPASKIASNLEKLEKNIGHIVSGFKKLHVEVVSMPENDDSHNE